jgi:hypothetical protein
VDLIIRRTNEFRKQEGRQPVTPEDKLTATARYFAEYMARTGAYGHTADGDQPGERAKKYGYQYCLIAENIAYEYNSAGFTTKDLADAFFEGWKKSPGHRENMLDRDVTQTGVAAAKSEKTGYYYAVQMFGRPESAKVTFKISNQTNAPIRYEVGGQGFSLAVSYTRTHELCRPAELRMLATGEASPKDKGEIFTPKSGDRYRAVMDESGEIRIVRE